MGERDKQISVVLLWGEEAFRILCDLRRRTGEDLKKLAAAVEIYVFDTEAAAEAFRQGICAARTREDVFELSSVQYNCVATALRVAGRKGAVHRQETLPSDIDRLPVGR